MMHMKEVMAFTNYFFDDLDSGDYVIRFKDDAGNLNLLKEGSTRKKFFLLIQIPPFL